MKTLGDIQYIITMAMIILKWEFPFFGLFFLATTAFNINEYPKIWQMNKLFPDKLSYGHMLDHSLIQSQQTKKLTRKTESVPELHKYIRNEIDLNWNSTVYINTAGGVACAFAWGANCKLCVSMQFMQLMQGRVQPTLCMTGARNTAAGWRLHLVLPVYNRAWNDLSRGFHNDGEGPFKDTILNEDFNPP